MKISYINYNCVITSMLKFNLISQLVHFLICDYASHLGYNNNSKIVVFFSLNISDPFPHPPPPYHQILNHSWKSIYNYYNYYC